MSIISINHELCVLFASLIMLEDLPLMVVPRGRLCVVTFLSSHQGMKLTNEIDDEAAGA